MLVTMMKSKLHRATVTEANLNYVGSITIDQGLMDQAGIYEGEKVQIVNVNNGERFETYTIAEKAGSKVVCLNGAAARLVQPGDKVIIMAYGLFSKEELETYEQKILFLDDDNNIIDVKDKEKHGEVY